MQSPAPVFLPALHTATTSRRTYTRPDSVSPGPSASPYRSRWSHSRGRPSVSSEVGESVSRDRASEHGSRVPLFRRPEGVPAWEDQATLNGSAGALAEKQPVVKQVVSEVHTDWRQRFHPVAAHFLGHRGENKKPIIPWLSLISAANEELLLSFIGALVSILLACALSYGLALDGFGKESLPLAIGSMGATAILLYGIPMSPLSAPRNVIGGHLISALIGICISYLFLLDPHYSSTYNSGNAGAESWSHLTPVVGALSVSLSLVAMHLTRTLHPPGGATALIASVQSNAIQIHFSYLLLVLVNVVTMTLWAVVIGNVGRKSYPLFFWSPMKMKKVPIIQSALLSAEYPDLLPPQEERTESISPVRVGIEDGLGLRPVGEGEEGEEEERGRGTTRLGLMVVPTA